MRKMRKMRNASKARSAEENAAAAAAAALAVKAARGYYTWGRYAAMRFAAKNNVDSRLLRLALRLEMEDRITRKAARNFVLRFGCEMKLPETLPGLLKNQAC